MIKKSDCETDAFVPRREEIRGSISYYILEAHLEPIRIVPDMSASEMYRALCDPLLITANTIEPQKAKREVKVPKRFGQYFTHSSVINNEKEPHSYKQALKSGRVETWLDAMQ